MIAASVIAVLSVLLGAAVGFSRRVGDRHLGPVRSFAFAAALAVVVGQFLPDALEGIGVWAGVPFAIGVLAPWALERITARISRGAHSLGLEVGYLGLLVHQLGDGVGMGTYTGPRHEGHSHTDVFLAIGGHTVPVAAMVVVAFVRAKGPKVAAVRALGLAAAVLAGVLGSRLSSLSVAEAHHAAISALVAGLLLHIAMHDLRSNAPGSVRERAADLGAAALGLGVVVATSSGHEHEHVAAVTAVSRVEPFDRIAPLALHLAPPLLVGLVATALVHALGSRALSGATLKRWIDAPPTIARALAGVALGAAMPALVSGSVRAADALRRRGAAPATVIAFALSVPALGVDGVLVSSSLFGPGAAAVRWLGGALAASTAALLAARLVSREREQATEHGEEPEGPTPTEPLAASVAHALDELVHHAVPWLLVGLVAASYASAALDLGALSGLAASHLDLLVVLALAIPGYVSPIGMAPLVWVLLERGLSPWAVLVGWIAGPAIEHGVAAWVSRRFGVRAALAVGAVAATTALALGYAGGASASALRAVNIDGERPGVAAIVSLSVLGLFALGSAFRRGVRGFFASVLAPADPAAHGHDHLHDGPCEHHEGFDAEEPVELSMTGR
jgi:uncharacterized membrane protein YraQ (UPF0718 family)